MAGEVTLAILLQAKDETGPALTSVEGHLTKMEKASGVAKAAFGALAGVAGSVLVGALSEAANAGAQEEASLIKIKTAVENSGLAYGDVENAITAVINKGKELGFHNNELDDSFALLVEQTGSTDAAMQRIAVAENLARGAHIDLYTASKLLGKATDENSNILARYGIHVQKGADVTTMLAEVQAKFGGQAEAYGASTAGAIDRTKVAIEGWQASIGNALGPAQQYIALLPGITSGMSLAGGAVGALSTLIKGTMIPSFLATIPATIAMMVPFLPLILIIGAIALAVGVLALAWSNNWGDIQGKAAAVIGFLGDLFSTFGSFLTGLWSGASGAIQGDINAIVGPIQGLIGVVQTALGFLAQLGAAQAANAASAVQYDQDHPYTGPQQPGFATGTNYVPYTGLFKLHQGEAVIPASQNRSGTGSGGGITININGDVVGLSKTELAQELGAVMYRQYRVAGGRL